MNDKRKILIVDDVKTMLLLLKSCLAPDFHLQICQDPKAALSRLQQQTFDVIISDYLMPGMDGIDLLSQAKSCQPHCARVLLTSDRDLTTVQRAVKEGHISAFISKPWQNPRCSPVLQNWPS
ncbi:response regulator [Photobacterium sp. TY1-4]|uniref:response regulator n=1 Tax=Photobacterium sp. TY1-4 TaxID=2899122 RepID=UPI0021BF496E|nr:response regulator [Photobacterium sp. TY1-4]UXI00231.1 response regulator [Photobacterium sp. TY1-4]